MQHITEVTRRDILDALRFGEVNWSGRLDDVEFLSRIFDLSSLPSTDGRFDSMAGDIWQHRVNNFDWSNDWIFSDERLNLIGCDDETFLKFLCEIVHPVVRSDVAECEKLVSEFNLHLKADGYELAERKRLSGHPIYESRHIDSGTGAEVPLALDRHEDRLWKTGCFRLFVSHISTHKQTVSRLRDALLPLRVSAFVAHEDIEPSREWLVEIECALRTMDAMLVYLTDDFHSSKWTDHEIGFAVCRRVLIIPVRVDIDPYGFIAKTQGISGRALDVENLASRTFELLANNEKAGAKIVESAVTSFEKSKNFFQAKDNMQLLQRIERFPVAALTRIEKAVATNDQLIKSAFVQNRIRYFLDSKREKAF